MSFHAPDSLNARQPDSKRRKIVPVLLSGGAGTRLWPLSRESYPKQLHSLLGEQTLIQQTALRTSDDALFASPLVIAHEEHRFVIAEQLRSVGIADATIVLEPVRRNTAPAVAIAALIASKDNPDATLLVMPVDHLVQDTQAFREAVETGLAGAAADRLVLFGVRPTVPATGYGYIKTSEPIDSTDNVFGVAQFVEKPSLDHAKDFVAAGDYLWNSGTFLLPARLLLDELERWAPDILNACRAALAGATSDLDFLRLPETPYAKSPSISLDYAVLEKTDRTAVVPVTFGWSDIGNWSELWAVGEKNVSGNVEIGEVVSENATGCYLRGDGVLVAALGVDGLIVAATPDVVLVTNHAHSQEVGKIVNRLKLSGNRTATQTQCVYRPWGYYQQIHTGERFQVKRITVNPGCKLSLQKHFHRAEHWVVVNGTALVTRNNEKVLLRENESLFIPLGAMHRLENPGRLPLNLIEVQSGAYLGEDDIVRVEDIYNRAPLAAE